MNVVVFGSTGGVGALIVDELLTDGNTVTVYVRNRGKVPERWASKARIIVGELADATSVDSCVKDADAVISALGPPLSRKANGFPLIEGTRHIVDSMHRDGVRRYIGLATPSVFDHCGGGSVSTRFAWTAKSYLRRAHDEVVAMTRVVTSSHLDWTIVRFLQPVDGAPRRATRVGYVGDRVTRADIARFTVDQLTDVTWLRGVAQLSSWTQAVRPRNPDKEPSQ